MSPVIGSQQIHKKSIILFLFSMTMACFNGLASPEHKREDPYAFECQTHTDKFQEEWIKHEANNQRQLRSNKSGFWPQPTNNIDIGNVAVIEDDGTIIMPEKLFDLDYRSILFTPNSTNGYDVTALGLTFDPELGERLNLHDDDSAQVNFSQGFGFSFYGAGYTNVFVNSNGNLTFGAEDSSFIGTPLRLLSGPPRIALLWDDLVPERGRGVFAKQSSEKLVITWDHVPLYYNSFPNTFQVTLFSDGRILLTYFGVTGLRGLVGLSPGSVSQGAAVDFRDLPISGLSGALYEQFTTFTDIDVINLARKFYQTHTDIYDSLITWTNFDLGGLFAFFMHAKNDVEGIGLQTGDNTARFGSSGRLGGLIMMNNLHIWPTDPSARIVGLADSMLSILGQEQGHRWMTYTYFDNDGILSSELLGRQGAHWSFFHNTESTMSTASNPRSSAMEGNVWRDNGNNTFTSTSLVDGYSLLDQYLMGLRGPAEVPDFFFITNPNETTKFRGSSPNPNDTVRGTKKTATVDRIIAVEGPRVPDAANAPKNFHSAFILLVKQGTRPSQPELQRLELYRTSWERYFARATDQRASVDTTLSPNRAIASISPVRSVSGRTFDATITGTGLSNASDVRFTGDGVTATIRPGGDDYRLPIAVTVDPSAALGHRRFSVTTPGGTLESAGATLQVTNYSTRTVAARGLFTIAVGPTGDLYGSDTVISGRSITGRVLRIPPEGEASVFAEGFTLPTGLAFNRAGDLFVADAITDTIWRITPDGQKHAFASGLSSPAHIAFDGNDNLYVANLDSPAITKITSSGAQSVFARIPPNGAFGLAFDRSGILYASDFDGGTVYAINPQGGARIFAVTGPFAEGLAVDPAGNVFVGNGYRGTILRIATTGEAATLGKGLFYGGDVGLAFNASGELLAVAVGQSEIFRFAPSVATEPPGGPWVGGITPRLGKKGSSITAALHGTALQGAQALSFRGKGINATVLDGVQSHFVPVRIDIAEDAEPGPHMFLLALANGSVRSGEVTFFVADQPPVINAASPASASVGQNLRVSGSGFPEDPLDAVVRFVQGDRGFSARPSFASANSLVATVPNGLAAGAVTISVFTRQGGESGKFNFMISDTPAPPVIVSLTPATPAPGQRAFITVDGLPGTVQNPVSLSINQGANQIGIPTETILAARENPDAGPITDCCEMEAPGKDSTRRPAGTAPQELSYADRMAKRMPGQIGRAMTDHLISRAKSKTSAANTGAYEGLPPIAVESQPHRRLSQGILIELPNDMTPGEASLNIGVTIDGKSSPPSASFRFNVSREEPSSYELKGVAPHVRGVGQRVAIASQFGEGFSPVLSNNVALFHQGERRLDATAVAFSGTQAVFTVPVRLQPGTAQVMVATRLGPDRWVTSGLTSIIIAPAPTRPAINAILPVAAGPGATIRIDGPFGSFSETAANNTITFLQGDRSINVRATAADPLGSSLTLTVPNGLAPGLAEVTVTSTFNGVASEPSSRFGYSITGSFVFNVPVLLSGYNAQTEDAYVTGIALANPTEQKAAVSFTAYNPDGTVMLTEPNPTEITIGPGEQIPITFAELLGLSAARPRLGWVQIRSNAELKGLFLIFDRNFNRFIDGADVTVETGTQLIFPHWESNQRAGTKTFYALANPNQSAANVALEFFDGAGHSIATEARLLPAMGCALIKPPVGDQRGGFLKVTSDQSLSGLLWFGSLFRLSVLKARPVTAPASRLTFPHFAVSDTIKTDLSITNLSTQAATVAITAFDNAGRPLGHTTRTLTPNQQLLESVASLFVWPEVSDIKTGYIIAQSSVGGIVGFTNFIFANGDAAAVLAESVPRNRLVFSHIAHNVPVERGRALATGIALLNPGPTAAAKYTMTVFNGQGQRVATKALTLPPNHKASKLLSASDPNAAFFDQEITLANGYIVVTSDNGLMGFELFFTNDLLQVAAVPAQ